MTRELCLKHLKRSALMLSSAYLAGVSSVHTLNLKRGLLGYMRCCGTSSGPMLLGIALFLSVSASSAPLQLISTRDPAQNPPAGGSGDSWGPILSPKGRYVLFASTANNLVTNSNGNPLPIRGAPRLNAFLRDRFTHSTILVSPNFGGTAGGNGDSIPTGLSTHGRYALFESRASDLVPNDTNGVTDIFLRDVWSNTTTLVSISMSGGAANGVSRSSVMTPDGRYVAFVSAATNLVPDDTNGIPDIFVRDLQTATTTLVSVGAQNTNSARGSLASSESPAITPDGRFVVFYSTATNLIPGAGGVGEIFVRDLRTATTIWASSNTRALLGYSNAVSYNQTISSDGKYVTYQASTNSGDLPTPNAQGSIIRFKVNSGRSDLISTNATVQNAAYEDIRSLDITPDGRSITFVANTNSGTSFAGTQIHVWDDQSGTTTVASVDRNNSFTLGSINSWPAIDRSGRYVAFLSSATNLVTNSIAGDYHLYVRDLQSAATLLVDSDTNNVGSSVGPDAAPRISADGHCVAFESPDSNLISDDRNHAYDIFLRDISAGTNELISAHHPVLPSLTPNAPSLLSPFSLSANGRYITFCSDADNLTLSDTNFFRDVFVRDIFLGTTILVSVSTNGVPAHGLSSEPAISADGRMVAFTSSADDLIAGDTNKAQDVFLRDLQKGTTTLVSWNTNATGPGNRASYSPAILGNGKYVLFRTTASDVAIGTGSADLVLRDMQAGTTYALPTSLSGISSFSATADGRFIAFGEQYPDNIYLWDSRLASIVWTNSTAQASVSTIAISHDGKRIAFIATGALYAFDLNAGTRVKIGPALSGLRSGLRFSSDGATLVYSGLIGNTNQVFLYDFAARSNLLVSQGIAGLQSGPSDMPDISADGRFIAYRSFATNLTAASDANSVPDIFLYDTLLGTTSLLTANRQAGGSADNRSVFPLFSGDGHMLLFQSPASDLVAQDFNFGTDLFAYAFLYVSVAPATTGRGPTLSWPARPGETYQVQFKNSLSEPQWQNVSGTVSITGNQAQLTDLTASSGQRFYRVVAF